MYQISPTSADTFKSYYGPWVIFNFDAYTITVLELHKWTVKSIHHDCAVCVIILCSRTVPRRRLMKANYWFAVVIG